MRSIIAIALFLALSPAWAGDTAWIDQRFSQLEGEKPWRIRLLRNEIFARHGRIFKSKDLQDFFSHQPWYKPDPHYSDSSLSQPERELVKKLSLLEKASRPPFDGKEVVAEALKRTKAGAGIPDGIGNVVLGKPAPSVPIAEAFLELPGQFESLISEGGNVVWAGFHVGIDPGWDDDAAEEALIELIQKRLGGLVPQKEFGNQVWRMNTRTLRLMEFAASGAARFTLVIHNESPKVPGSRTDGFVEFLKSFQAAITAGAADKASAFIVFPIRDEWGGEALTCSNASDFASKLPQFKKEQATHEVSSTLGENGEYTVYFGSKLLTAKRIDGKWRITGFAYGG